MGKIVGIDLGTTNSVVAVKMGNDIVVIPTSEGRGLCHQLLRLQRLVRDL